MLIVLGNSNDDINSPERMTSSMLTVLRPACWENNSRSFANCSAFQNINIFQQFNTLYQTKTNSPAGRNKTRNEKNCAYYTMNLKFPALSRLTVKLTVNSIQTAYRCFCNFTSVVACFHVKCCDSWRTKFNKQKISSILVSLYLFVSPLTKSSKLTLKPTEI